MNARLMLMLLLPPFIHCCRTSDSKSNSATLESATHRRKPPRLPDPSRGNGKVPWGGTHPEKWRPEAIVANAASWLMNEAWDQPDVVDVVVSIPGKFEIGWKNPYDDGQSNAMMHFNQWRHSTPPMIAALVFKADGTQSVVIWLAKEYVHNPQYIELMSPKVPSVQTKLKLKTLPSGAVVAQWNPPPELGWKSLQQTESVFVRPGPDFSDWLPLYFRMPVHNAQDLVKKLPSHEQQYADGAPLLDREQLKQVSPTDQIPFAKALNHSFAGRYNIDKNGAPYEPEYIHGQFDGTSKRPITAVGQGWTWVAQRHQPFKILYTCFASRAPEGSPTGGSTKQIYNEATAPDGGVVSGGGWHVIGEVKPDRPDWFASETIFNDVENAPIMVAAGFENPPSRVNKTPPSGSSFAYGLSDVATLRWLWPGEAFVTVASASKKNYHWFFFDFNREVCTEEWVYECAAAQRNHIAELKCD